MTSGNGAYIPYNDEDEDDFGWKAVIARCPNHTVFVEVEPSVKRCIACGGESEAIVKASNKMLTPQGDPGRGRR